VLLALLAALLFVVQTLALKKLPAPGSARAPFGVIAAYSAPIAVGLLFWRAFADAPGISAETWGYGASYGIVFVLTMFFYSRAMNAGPLSYSSFYFSVSLMVPVVASMTFWGEGAGPFKLAGLGLFLLSFYFIQVLGPGSRRESAGRRSDKRWLLYCAMAFLFNGLLPVVAKLHQSALSGSEAPELMLVGFSSAAVCAFAVWAALGLPGSGSRGGKRGAEKAAVAPEPDGGRIDWRAAGWIAVVGAATGTGNALVTHLTSRLPGAFLFPFVNGSMIVLLTLASALLYREKLSRGGLAGIATGILAIDSDSDDTTCPA